MKPNLVFHISEIDIYYIGFMLPFESPSPM